MATVTEERWSTTAPAPRGFIKGHHIAYLVKDQEATRHFYEDVVGLPLVAAWAEVGEFPEFPGRQLEYCHSFFALDDGSTIAFFCFHEQDVYEFFRREQSPFIHVAVTVTQELQDKVAKKIADLGVVHFMIDHGFVKSLYMRDPDGLTFEMAVDPADYDEIMAWQAKTAHETLRRWNAGDYTPNNNFRDDHTFRNVYTERE